MKKKMLEQMAAVTDAQYLREHAKIKPVLDREARLRGQLNKLSDQINETKSIAQQDHSMKMLGADFLWQAWHTKARRELNTELAQVTSQKLMAMHKLRKSFGRKIAVEGMVETEKNKTKLARIKALEERLLP